VNAQRMSIVSGDIAYNIATLASNKVWKSYVPNKNCNYGFSL